jgi:O-methyltransferase
MGSSDPSRNVDHLGCPNRAPAVIIIDVTITTRAQQARGAARSVAASTVKHIAYRTGLHRAVFPRYEYMFRPMDLALLTEALTATSGMPGPILEVGCAGGNTTIFLCRHLDDLADRRAYHCIDTFAGFTEADVAVEASRGKPTSRYRHTFRAYRKPWFEQTMRNNGIDRVRVIEADANSFDFSVYDGISFCLIDVDLYRPVRTVLEAVIPRLAPGGIVVVDDCLADHEYDGALQAYQEITAEHGLASDIRGVGLGFITAAG